MTPEMLQIWLAVAGWLAAFFLGKELSKGFNEWRLRRAERQIRDDD